jgi:hypothetical protein
MNVGNVLDAGLRLREQDSAVILDDRRGSDGMQSFELWRREKWCSIVFLEFVLYAELFAEPDHAVRLRVAEVMYDKAHLAESSVS